MSRANETSCTPNDASSSVSASSISASSTSASPASEITFDGPSSRNALSSRIIDPIPNEDYFKIMDDRQASMIGIRFLAFDTVVELALYGNDEEDASEQERACAFEALQAAKDLCREYERLFSRTLPHSDISKINEAQAKAVPIDPKSFDLLSQAKRYCELSWDTFDITIGPVTSLWDIKNKVVPNDQDIKAALAHVNWRNLELICDKDGKCFAQLNDPEASIDIGGIAKGWIADRLIEKLSTAGFSGILVNLGGNVAAWGKKPSSTPWHVGIRDPHNNDTIIGKISIEEGSVVTSGICERCFTKDRRMYHHILNPTTGHPVHNDILSVTVVCEDSIDAEGYSTTLLALGLERGCTFVFEHPEIIQAFFVTGDRQIVCARQ